MPNVVPLQESLAIQKITNANLTPNVIRDYDENVKKGLVISQNPNAGARVVKNSTVDITVSRGPPPVTVPNVIGKSRDDAVATLSDAGLQPKVFTVHSSRPPNTVTGQDPAGGKKVTKGARVRINVSSGPQPVSVPYVVGISFDQASAQLQSAGFAVARKNVESDQPRNTVIDQNPTGSAAPGATITLSVSKGPKQSTVPDVTNQDEDSATSTLQAAGFQVTVEHQDVQDPGLDGVVISQNPAGGSKAKKGSKVAIVVGSFTAGTTPGTTTGPTGP